MRVLLAGASGFIGSHIQQALTAAGHEVIPADRHHGIDFNQMLKIDAWLPHLKNIDAVINAVGIIAENSRQKFENLHRLAPEALFSACSKSGVNLVVQISALGADEHAFTPYQLSKKAADDALRKLPLDWFVLRPSLVYGAGGASLAMFRRMASFPLLPLADGGRQLVQPVHVSDVVATVLQCLQAETAGKILDVVGPEPLTFAAWLNLIRQKEGKPPARILPIPFGLIVAMARVGRYLMPLLHPDNLRMLQKGNTADVQPLVEFLGRPPLSAEEAL